MTDDTSRRGVHLLLRDLGPVLVVLGLGVWAYVGLRVEVGELRTRLDTMQVAPAAAAPAPSAPAPAAGVPPLLEPVMAVGPPAVPPAVEPPPVEPPPANDPPWQCAGTIPSEAVRQVVGRHGRVVFDCYAARRAADPDLQGTLVLGLLVGSQGEVRSARSGGTLDDQALMKCIVEDLPKWQFPVPTDGDCAVVSAPFHLAPPESNAPDGGRPAAPGGDGSA